MTSLCLYVIVVKVPIELGLAFLLQSGEELLLHTLEYVESNEDITLVFKMYIRVVYHLSV